MRFNYGIISIALISLCWGAVTTPALAEGTDTAPIAPQAVQLTTSEKEAAPAKADTNAPDADTAANAEDKASADNAAGDKNAAAEPASASADGNVAPTGEAPQSDALSSIKKDLVSPTQEVISTEMKPKLERFTLLRSDNIEDYKRRQGIWISDSGNGRIIYMKDFNGNDFYSMGNAGCDIGQFLNPEQVWVDFEGNIYIADRDNDRIIRVEDVRGRNWTEKKGFKNPRGVAYHGKRLYVSDTGNNRILVYDKFDSEVPMATLQDKKIDKPGYLWLDMEGNLYVACGSYPPGGCIVRIPHDLTVLPSKWQVYEGNGLRGNSFSPGQICITDDGLYTTDTATQRLIRLNDISGRTVWELGSYGNGVGEFVDPLGISQDEEGNIYVVDTNNDRIVKMKNIRGQGWKVYDTLDPTFGLRSPHSIFVWSPRPDPADLEEGEGDSNDKDKDKDKKDKKDDKDTQDEKPESPKLIPNPDGNGAGFAI